MVDSVVGTVVGLAVVDVVLRPAGSLAVGRPVDGAAVGMVESITAPI